MQNKLVLNDGTEIINGFVSKSSRNQLMIRVPGNDIVQATLLFSDHEKTKEITCYYSIHKIIYTGYTDMYTVQYFSDGDYVEIWLRPDEDSEISIKQEITVPEEYVPKKLNTEEGEQ